MAVLDVVQAPFLLIEPGLELLDNTNTLIGDISDDLQGGYIEHDSFRKVAGTCNLSIERELQWHNQRVRPYVTVSADINGTTESYTYNMGVYVLDTPARVLSESPQVFNVVGYDLTSLLDTPRGATYELASGSSYLTAVDALLTEFGFTDYNIDQTQAAATTPSRFIWSIDERNTYLKIINDLLLGVGYLELYADRNGTLQAIPFDFPQDKTAVWSYDTQSENTIVSENVTAETDLHDIPNKWVFIRDDPSQALPTEGAGIYTVTNQSSGITSIDQRGYTKTAIHRIETAYTQTELQITGDRVKDRESQPQTTAELRVGPNPVHFHYEVITLNAPEIGVGNDKFLVLNWTFSLNGEDMTISAQKVI